MHSRPPAAVPNTPEPTSNRKWPDFKWNAELGQPIPVTPEPITESTPESTAEAMPAATTQTDPREDTMPAAQFMAEVVAAGITAGIEAMQRTTTKAQSPEYKRKRSYGGQVIHNNQRPAKQPSLTTWKEITEDKFRSGYRDKHQIEDVRKWAGKIQEWVTEAEMLRMFGDIGYCLVLNPDATTLQHIPPDLLQYKYTTDHTTKYYYTPHVDPCSAWPDGVEQHVDAFFHTHREAKRDNALWGFLL